MCDTLQLLQTGRRDEEKPRRHCHGQLLEGVLLQEAHAGVRLCDRKTCALLQLPHKSASLAATHVHIIEACCLCVHMSECTVRP